MSQLTIAPHFVVVREPPPDRNIIRMACLAVRRQLPAWYLVHPRDHRPLRAVEAAEAWAADPTPEREQECYEQAAPSWDAGRWEPVEVAAYVAGAAHALVAAIYSHPIHVACAVDDARLAAGVVSVNEGGSEATGRADESAAQQADLVRLLKGKAH